MDAGDSDTFRSLERAVTRALLSPDASPSRLDSGCEAFVDSELYTVAWIGHPDSTGERVAPVATVGIAPNDLEALRIDAASTEPRAPGWAVTPQQGSDPGPSGDGGEAIDPEEDTSSTAAADSRGSVDRVVATDPQEIRVSGERPAAASGSVERSGRSTADERVDASDLGCRSIATVPLRAGGVLRGVLLLGTDREAAFAPAEREALAAIGETIARALDAEQPAIAHGQQRVPVPGSGSRTESDREPETGSDCEAETGSDREAETESDSEPETGTDSEPARGLDCAGGPTEHWYGVSDGDRAPLRELQTLDRIVETVDDGIYALDAASRFTMVNDAYCALLGYEREELLGEPASMVHSEAIDAQVSAEIDAARSEDGVSMPIEITVTAAGGVEVPVEVQVTPFEYDDGTQGRVGVVRDVSDRKRRKRELEEYRTITEAASDVIVVIDESSFVRSVNPAVEDVFGYEPDALLGESLTMLMSEELSRAHVEGLQRYLDTGQRTLDWGRVELPGRHADGHEVPLSISFSEYEYDGERLFAGIVRDVTERAQYERALSGLHDATRDLIAAESAEDVADRALGAATDVLELDGVGIYLFDDADNELRPAATTAYVRELFGGLPTFGPGDTSITWETFLAGESVAHDDVLESDAIHTEETPLRSGVWIPLGDHGVLAIVSERVGGIGDRIQQLADHLAATTEAALDRIAREESLRKHERTLAERNRRLEELDRMNGVIREIDQELVRATTKADIERAVCERLTTEGRFAFAWIGGVQDGAVGPRTSAGEAQTYLDDAPLSLDAIESRDHAHPNADAVGQADESATTAGRTDVPSDASFGDAATVDAISADSTAAEPAVATAATGEVTVVSNVSTNLGGAPWSKLALARGLQSAIAIPLVYGGMRYGVLAVYADTADAFDDLSRVVLVELGETIANAMNAVETERALLTDSAVELELAIHDADDFLARLVETTGTVLEVDGIVPQAAGATRIFVTASGAGADAIGTAAERSSCIETVTLLDQGNEEHRFEMTVTGRTIPTTLVECGAATKSVRLAPEEIRAIVELPHAVDVRTFVDRLEATYPDVELVARRDVERGGSPGESLETKLTESLTDRQLEALQTAYLSGYFEWPRDRTGEEVAASLGITQSTFNGHLRAAERKLCTKLFERTRSSR